jgi:hypothetical protein
MRKLMIANPPGADIPEDSCSTLIIVPATVVSNIIIVASLYPLLT